MNVPRDKLEPLSPELESLLSAAAGDDGPGEETRERLYARLSGALALPPAPLPSGGETLGLLNRAAAALGSAKPVLAFALAASGIGLAGVTSYMAMRPSPSKGSDEISPLTEAPAPESPQQARLGETPASPRISLREPAERREDTPPIPKTVPVASKTDSKKAQAAGPTPVRYTMADERRLIEAARTSLHRGEVNRALTLLAKHRRLYKAGRFTEERDALYILSLSKKGKYRTAKRSAKRFFKTYPYTVFKDAVNAALRNAPQ